MVTAAAHSFCSGFFFGRHVAHVVAVAERHVAFALMDGLDLGAVVALRSARQVGLDAQRPFLRPFGPFGGDDRGKKRDVVDVLSRTGTDASLETGGDKILVVGDLARLNARLVRVDHPRPGGQAEPQALGVAVLGRDVGLEDRRVYGLRQPGFDQIVEAADIRRQYRVGRAVPALRLESFQHARPGKDHVDLDPGLAREGVEKGFDQEFLAVGVEIDLLGAPHRLAGDGGNRDDKRDKRHGGRKFPSHGVRRGFFHFLSRNCDCVALLLNIHITVEI